jgi:hypothetical protein
VGKSSALLLGKQLMPARVCCIYPLNTHKFPTFAPNSEKNVSQGDKIEPALVQTFGIELK